jgi:hypothetical protein
MNTSGYPDKKAKVRQYSDSAIDRTIARVSFHLSNKNNKGEDSRICDVLREMLKNTTPLNQSIFIRTFNELANDYDDQFAPLWPKQKSFYVHYWVATAKAKFMNHIQKIDDEKLVSHANCLARAFLRDARHWSK